MYDHEQVYVILYSNFMGHSNSRKVDLVYFPMLNNKPLDRLNLLNTDQGLKVCIGCNSPRRPYITLQGHVMLRELKEIGRALTSNHSTTGNTRAGK